MNVICWINRRWWFFPLCCLLTAPPLVLAVGRWLLPWWLTSPDSILMFFLQSILCGGILGLTIALPLGVSRGLRSRFTNREIDLAAQALLQACDPTPLVVLCQELQTVWARSRPRPLTNAVIQFNFARALEELGRVAEGERELERLLPLYERYQSFMKLNIDLSAVSVKLKAGKPDEARSFLREGERHLGECRLAAHTAEAYRAALEQRQ